MYSVEYLHLSILLCTFNAISKVSTQSSCGDWHQINDLKCIKIISDNHFYNFYESEQVCLEANSVLLTIHSSKEQEFINEFLFKINTIGDNIWIGLTRNTNNGNFEWSDASDSKYRNWNNGSPSNETNNNCVQLTSESGQTGKWVNIQCRFKNNKVVVCQKSDNYLISDLQKIISETRELLNETREQLTNTQNKVISNEIVLNQTREQLTNTQNKVISNEIVLNQTKEQLMEEIEHTKGELNQTRSKFNILLEDLFNKWLHYKLFTDSDGKRKAFFIPMNEYYKGFTFDEAVNTCNNYNATLVEPKTPQKQHIFETFLGQIGLESNKMDHFWINSKRDSSGKFRWISSGEEFTFTNWYTNYPVSINGWDYVLITVYVSEANIALFGKWWNYIELFSRSVVCEQEIYI